MNGMANEGEEVFLVTSIANLQLTCIFKEERINGLSFAANLNYDIETICVYNNNNNLFLWNANIVLTAPQRVVLTD